MANQIVVSSGAKVRDLNDVIIGTSGVLSSLAFNVANGVPKLDSSGKILVSQLPNSVMEYLGTWDASTNTPTLVNGTGNAGDVYLCNVAGTTNFGAGPIAFFVGDQVIYSGSIWQRASGATGTVTSVAVTETGDSLNITGSPITTSGTINIGFNGTNLQYINGAGDLTTFPTLSGYVTSVTGTAPVVSSGGTTPAISMAAATASVDGYLSAANFVTFNNKQNAITLTTTGTSGASTLVGATLNIPNYGSALTGYVPYTGATQDVDLGAFKLNAQSLHAKGTGGNGHLGLKHQSASATASANEVSLFADSLGDLSWLNGNLYLSKFITSGNTAARSYTFPNANGTVALTSDISYPVTSVFGRTGAVVATSGDYTTTLVTEGTNLYYTDVRARASLSFVAGSGAYNSTTGVITIPTNNTQITNGANYITLASLSATSPIFYNSTTGVISSQAASATLEGYVTTGTQIIAGLKAFNDAITGNSGIAFLNGVMPPITNSNYSGIGGNSQGISIVTRPVSTNYTNNLYFPSASNSYTFPNASGTLALLESTQTFTGTNTFSGSIIADGSVLLKNNVTSFLAGYVNLGGIATGYGFSVGLPNGGTPLINQLIFNSSAAYNYTFPNATGTLALTSDLTGYVTLATAQTISGAKTFSASVVNDDGLKIKFGSASNLTASYLTLSAYGTTGPNTTVLRLGTTASTLSELIFSQTSSYAYTFPALTGTIAILEAGTQTFTGTVNVLGSLGTKYGISIEKGNTPSPLSFNDIFIYASSGATSIINFANSSYITSFSFPTSNQTFTYPAATGTLALGTGTTNYISKFTGTNTIGNSLIFDNGTNVGIGNTNTSYTLDVSGSLRNTTSAYFATTSGSVGIGTTTINGTLSLPISTTNSQISAGSFEIQSYAVGNSWCGDNLYYNGTNFVTRAAGRAKQIAFGGGEISFNLNTTVYTAGQTVSLPTVMTITTAGNVGIGTSSPNQLLELSNGGNDLYLRITRGAQYGTFGLNSTGIQIASAGTDPLYFSTNGSERMRITSGGNVYVSKSTDTSAGISHTGSFQVDKEIMATGSLGGIFWENRSGGVTSNSNWYGWYAVSGTTYFFNGSNNIGNINSSSGVYTATSDINRKKDFEPSTLGLNAILNLKPTLYRMKEDKDTSEKQLGFIAQEVKEFIPQAYVENGDDENKFIGLQDRPFIAVLVKAIQEMNAKLNEQNQTIQNLQEQINILAK